MIKVFWAGFSPAEKLAWHDCDPRIRQNGWQMFVADQSKRIKGGLEGVATPSSLHQDLVGALVIEAPAEELKISQLHPGSYYTYTKVIGTKSQYQPVFVTEAVYLPLKITINYKADLTSTGAGSFAKFYAIVEHFYQGQTLETTLEINIPLSSAWATQNITLSNVLGEVVGYNLYLHVFKARGVLLFDKPKAEHSAQNWVRDPYCKDISKTFTRAFKQIPQNWVAVTLPTGAAYNSYYPE